MASLSCWEGSLKGLEADDTAQNRVLVSSLAKHLDLAEAPPDATGERILKMTRPTSNNLTTSELRNSLYSKTSEVWRFTRCKICTF